MTLRSPRVMKQYFIIALFSANLVVGFGLTETIAGEATDAMKITIDEVLRILDDKEFKQPSKASERRELLEKVVGERFDYEVISGMTLSIRQGEPWKILSEKERNEFVELFRALLVRTYAEKIESYSGEGVKYINESSLGDGRFEVRTKVLTSKTDIPLDYRLFKKGSVWKVYDVLFDGSTSLVSSYRSQFKTVLNRGSFTDLIDQLRKKSENHKAP